MPPPIKTSIELHSSFKHIVVPIPKKHASMLLSSQDARAFFSPPIFS